MIWAILYLSIAAIVFGVFLALEERYNFFMEHEGMIIAIALLWPFAAIAAVAYRVTVQVLASWR